MTTRRRVFSAQVGGTPQGAFNLNVSTVPQPTDIPRTTNPNTSVTIYENAIPHAAMDPNFIGMNITNGDLGSYAYLVHVDFDVFQVREAPGPTRCICFEGQARILEASHFLTSLRARSRNQQVNLANGERRGSSHRPHQALARTTRSVVPLAADTNHVVQFQGCKFRIERLES